MPTSMSGFDTAKPTVPAELNTTPAQHLCQRHRCYCTGPVSNGSSEMLPFQNHQSSGRKAEKITMGQEDSEGFWRDDVLGRKPEDLTY